MKRRKFIQSGGPLLLSTAAISAFPFQGFASNTAIPAISTSLIKPIRDRIVPIRAEERHIRQNQAKALMIENKIEAIFLEGGTSMNYFTGIHWGRSERMFACILPQQGEPVFISPKFEEARAREQVGEVKLVTWEEHESPFEVVRQILKEKNLLSANIAMEETTRYFITEGIQKTIPDIRISSASVVTAGCRSIKSAHEIELMQIANDMAAEVYKWAVPQLKEGMTEAMFASIISNGFEQFGVEGGALVLFGDASALPHGHLKENKLKQGDIVLIDGGCTVEGYESDITRTTVFGNPTKKMKTIFSIVSQAQEAALQTASLKGVRAEEVDASARKVISEAGYGPGYKYFTHRLGHGIGMDGHEWYYLVGGNKRTLMPGNMFSDEPGIYLVGEFGIRIEDELLITPEGARLLLPKAKSLEQMF